MSSVRTRLRVRPGVAPAPLVSVHPTSPLSEQGSRRRTSPAPPSHNVGQGIRQSDFISRIPIASPVVSNKDNANNSESSDSENDKNTNEWTTVQRKRSGKKYGTSKERASRRDVSAAVDSVIVEAEKSLTTAQKEIIALRQKKVNITSPDKPVPHEGGHSGSKGKGIDPRNWGNVHLSEDETNIEAQQAALNSFHSNTNQFERDEPPHAAVTQSEPEGRGESMARSRRASKTPTVRVPKNTRPLVSRPEAQIQGCTGI